MNAAWHKAHLMPAHPTPGQRLRWHLAHAKACGCRKLTAAMLKELRQRAEKAAPKRSGASRRAAP